MQAWVTEQISAVLLASHGANTMCQAGFFTQISSLTNEGIPGHHFPSLWSLEKHYLLSLSNGHHDTGLFTPDFVPLKTFCKRLQKLLRRGKGC